MTKPIIAAVVTSFNPPQDFFENIGAIARQCTFTVIIDNNSSSDFDEILASIPGKIPNTFIIKNSQNLGVATALNQGVRHILNHLQTDWIATFDHDTKIPNNFFDNLLSGIQDSKTAIVAPSFTYTKNPNLIKIDAVITSGSCHRTELFSKIGYFNDGYFIDCVDFEFCLRARANGLNVVQNQHIQIQHSLGHTKQKNFGPFIFYYHEHSSLRKFFIIRNSVWLLKDYLMPLPLWNLKYWLALSKDFVKDIIFSSNRTSLLKSYGYGLIQGILNPSSKPHRL